MSLSTYLTTYTDTKGGDEALWWQWMKAEYCVLTTEPAAFVTTWFAAYATTQVTINPLTSLWYQSTYS